MKKNNVIASAKRVAISAFVAVMAVCANAAAVDWSMGGTVLSPSPQGSTGKSDRCSFYTMLVYTSDQASTVNAALTATGGVDFETLTSIAKSSNTAGITGSFKGGMIDGLTGSSATLFAVVLDTQTRDAAADTAKYYYLTGEITQATYDPTGATEGSKATFGADQMIGTWTATTSSTSGGESETVPEPTSGLLLLIGAAGLALRRKRA